MCRAAADDCRAVGKRFATGVASEGNVFEQVLLQILVLFEIAGDLRKIPAQCYFRTRTQEQQLFFPSGRRSRRLCGSLCHYDMGVRAAHSKGAHTSEAWFFAARPWSCLLGDEERTFTETKGGIGLIEKQRGRDELVFER